jgi:hypothetical protein
MASELRILRFGLNEVGESLRSLGPQIGLDVPDGEFISTVAGSGEQASDSCFTMSGSLESVTISNNKLAACLIHYCKNHGIPLPRDGKKKIFVSPQFVELRIGMSYTPTPIDMDKAVELDT